MMDVNFNIVLVNPEIPQNTGSIGRLALATNCKLFIVGKPNFDLDEKAVRRAGLDYWKYVDVKFESNIDTFFESIMNEKVFFLTKHADKNIFETNIAKGSYLVFGGESFGLPESLLERYKNHVKIPMFNEKVRSLNLATSVGIVVYEGIRQNL